MWVQATGQLSEKISLLVLPASTHLVIIGEKIGLVDAGLSATSTMLIRELEKLIGQERQLDFVFLTHTHFDHLGGLPELRRRFPNLQVVGSPLSRELLSSAEVVESVYGENQNCVNALEASWQIDRQEFGRSLCVDKVLGDGDFLDLGNGVVVKAVFTPGHTRDSVCYFVPSECALCGGEALGSYSGRNLVTPCYSESYSDYMKSLEKISGLEVKFLGLGHGGVLTGELCQRYLADLRLAADKLSSSVKQQLNSGQTVDDVVATNLVEWREQHISPEGPFLHAQEEALRSMVQTIASGR